MPFDLIQPDDAPLLPGGEIDLPADLAALGEQLRDDALHLAKRYPAATQTELARREPATRSLSWKKLAVLATSGLATVLAGVFAVQFGMSQRGGPQKLNAPAVPVAKADEPSAAAAVPATIAAPPTISLTELSGPELEALLDLWQREPDRAEGTGVSF
jgi:hypothetical protein